MLWHYQNILAKTCCQRANKLQRIYENKWHVSLTPGYEFLYWVHMTETEHNTGVDYLIVCAILRELQLSPSQNRLCCATQQDTQSGTSHQEILQNSAWKTLMQGIPGSSAEWILLNNVWEHMTQILLMGESERAENASWIYHGMNIRHTFNTVRGFVYGIPRVERFVLWYDISISLNWLRPVIFAKQNWIIPKDTGLYFPLSYSLQCYDCRIYNLILFG